MASGEVAFTFGQGNQPAKTAGKLWLELVGRIDFREMAGKPGDGRVVAAGKPDDLGRRALKRAGFDRPPAVESDSE